MKIGNKKFDLKNETVVMGIINASPDSFSGDGLTGDIPETIKIVEKFIRAGVDIIDVGGESTRPKKIYSKVKDISVQQEIDRVLPVIEKIKTSFDIPVSIDTRKSAVASVAINYGADMINDVSMMKYDSNMIDLIFSSDKPYVLTHNYPINKTQSATFQVKDNLINELNRLKKAGINQDKIILDPGFGFKKDIKQNLEIHINLDEICNIGPPVLIGTSRKSFLGYISGNAPIDQRLEASLASVALAVSKGASFVRVHDVELVVNFLRAMKKLI